jgi:hypothetical protein
VRGLSRDLGYARWGPLVVCGSRTNGWFRLFGAGLWWKDTRYHRLYFSERNGHRPPSFTLGPVWFRWLRRGHLGS